MKYLFLPLILLMFNCILLSAESSKYSIEVEEKIEQVENNLEPTRSSNLEWSISDRMKYHKVHGLSIAVINNNKIEWAKGYGWADTSENRPVTTETLFQAASVSKSINAVGVLKLAQDNKLDLYADINNYLTSWKFPYDIANYSEKITTANLLSHSAGLSVPGFLGYSNGDTLPTIVQILDGEEPANSLAVRSNSEPGLRFEYSGGGTIISQLMITDITSTSYEKYMYDSILEPLGMTNSFYNQPPPSNKQNLLATAHDINGKEIKGKYNIYPEQAAAGLWTTPTDLCKFIIDIQLSNKDSMNTFLTKDMASLMTVPYIGDQTSMGAFMYNEEDKSYFQHTGANNGFRSLYVGGINSDLGVVIMTNSDNFTIITETFNSIAKIYSKDIANSLSEITSYNSNEIKVFPNPASDFISIKSPYKLNNYKLFNNSGVLIQQGKPESNRINVNTLPAGLYHLTLFTNEGVVSKKVVIE